jgi:hypothetical protein
VVGVVVAAVARAKVPLLPKQPRAVGVGVVVVAAQRWMVVEAAEVPQA